MDAEEILREAKVYLISKNFLYGMIIAQMRFVESDQIPTIGVTPHMHLFYNPKFVEQFSVRQMAACLEHEAWHIVAQHMSRLKFREEESRQLKNIACDLSINQYIDDLPEMAFLPKHFHYRNDDGELVPFPNGQNAETYYKLLQKETETFMCSGNCSQCIQQDGEGQGRPVICPRSIDDHSNWDDEGFKSEEFKAKAKTIIKNAKDLAEKTAGNIPKEVMQYLEDWFKPPVVPWQRILKRRIARGTLPSTDLKLSKYKESKRFPGMPGTTKIREAKEIIFSIDCSGSMPDEVLKQGFSEMKALYQKGYKVTVIQWDTTMAEPEPFKPTMKIEIKKRGGTDPTPVFKYVSQLKDYFHIMFTDGEFFNWPTECPDMKRNFIVFTWKPGYEAWISRFGDRGVMCVEL